MFYAESVVVKGPKRTYVTWTRHCCGFVFGLLVACSSAEQHVARAPAAASPPPSSENANPCRGRELDADRLAATCRHERPTENAPPPSALRIELEAPPHGVPTGTSAPAFVHFRNVSPAPLEFQLNSRCNALFDVTILGSDGRRVDLENEVGGLAVCGTVPGIRVTLEPGGVLVQRLEISTRAKRWVLIDPKQEDGPFELRPAGPVAPGRYTIDVATPLYSDHKKGWEAQLHAKAPLEITAH